MADTVRQWTLLLILTAFLLSVLVLGQIVTRYASAYLSAPSEVSAFLDALDSSVEENESYDHHLARVPRLEDKFRLGRLLRDIQKAGDDLREELNALLLAAPAHHAYSDENRRNTIDEDASSEKTLMTTASATSTASTTATARLRSSARILWAARRAELSERVRRLDLLRMRFLVVYMSIVAATTTAAVEKVEKTVLATSPPRAPTATASMTDSERFAPGLVGLQISQQLHNYSLGRSAPQSPSPSPLSPSLADSIKRSPPLRRLTTQAMGHHDGTSAEDAGGGRSVHRLGWAGVVQELQRSPLMHKRHASIERAMSRSMTP